MVHSLLHDWAQANSYHAFIGPAFLGVLFHISIQTVEFEKYMFHFLAALPVMAVVMSTAFSAFCRLTWAQAIVRSVIIEIIFNLSCLVSIGTYCFLFRRCGRFPGPVEAKIIRFWTAYISSKDVQYYKELAKMQAKYGDFVRTGMITSLAPGRRIGMM